MTQPTDYCDISGAALPTRRAAATITATELHAMAKQLALYAQAIVDAMNRGADPHQAVHQAIGYLNGLSGAWFVRASEMERAQ